ncbi:MAG: YkgJ family cysteine cluster protein [Dissulfurimicrobium hydrothermale]|uniref:YkgJ family cysteine cluster protein n=1 Tax=Dissulfurimicrobium hydrothermale TaxID=1750598 RepID=UPI003C7299DC
MDISEAKKKADMALKREKLGSVIDPVRLEKKDTFRFRCHPGVSCFTHCCRNMNIILTPYDIIRLKKRLGMPSNLFLHLYAQPEILAQTGVPVARLKMLEKDGKCPFVTPDGCQVYTDRPVCCRYYPIGIASLKQDKGASEGEEFFFLIKESHCHGFKEQTEWTVDAWRGDQEADLYDSMNRGWLELLLRKRSFGEETEMPPKARQLFYMVTTNMERFRAFVFESRFLNTYIVKDEILKEILEDDVALMQFGFEYLKQAIFGVESNSLRLKEDILNNQIKKTLEKRKNKRFAAW